MNAPRSILIVRLSAIGDVIHALPILESLRRQLPEARLGWIVEELSAPLLENHPDLDKLYVIPKKRWRGNFRKYFGPEIRPFYQAIRRDGWEVSLDLQGLSKSALAAWASGTKLRVGFAGPNAREISPFLNNRKVRPRPEDIHVVEQNLRLLEGLGLEFPQEPPRGTIGIQESEREEMRQRLREAGWHGEGLVALNPGAGWSSKRWPPEHFARLGKQLSDATGLRPLILWGPKEEPLRDTIAKNLPGALSAPPTRVRELAVLISLCRMMVGGDTGPTHMAGLLGVPVVSIFGASDGSRNCPWPKLGPQPAGIVVQRLDLPCCPCWKTSCPLNGTSYLACLKRLEPDNVYEQIKPWLKSEGFL